MPMPKTKAEQLSEEILKILEKDVPFLYSLSEFEIKRVHALIDELQKYNIDFAHSFRGCILALAGSPEAAIAEHEKALSVSFGDCHILANYGSSLLRLGKHADSKEKYMKALEIEPANLVTLNGAIHAAYYAGDFNTLSPLLERYKKLAGNDHDAKYWLEEDAEDAAELAEHGEEYAKGPYTSLDDLKKELGL